MKNRVKIFASNAMVYHFLIPHINLLLEKNIYVDLICLDIKGFKDKLLKNIKFKQRKYISKIYKFREKII